MTEQKQCKPCTTFHPLPCGLDINCPMPVKYFNIEQSDEENWKEYVRHEGS